MLSLTHSGARSHIHSTRIPRGFLSTERHERHWEVTAKYKMKSKDSSSPPPTPPPTSTLQGEGGDESWGRRKPGEQDCSRWKGGFRVERKKVPRVTLVTLQAGGVTGSEERQGRPEPGRSVPGAEQTRKKRQKGRGATKTIRSTLALTLSKMAATILCRGHTGLELL